LIAKIPSKFIDFVRIEFLEHRLENGLDPIVVADFLRPEISHKRQQAFVDISLVSYEYEPPP
jgi:hypothetical protein